MNTNTILTPLNQLSEVHAAAIAKAGARSIGIIIADVKDDTSMQAMCARTSLILNCVGPYRFYGEQVVKVGLAVLLLGHQY